MTNCSFCGEKDAKALWHSEPCCYSCFVIKRDEQRLRNKAGLKKSKTKHLNTYIPI